MTSSPYGHNPGPAGYGQTNPAAAYGQPGPAMAPSGKNSPLLGIIALGVVVLCAVVMCIAMIMIGNGVGDLASSGAIDAQDQAAVTAAVQERFAIPSMLVTLTGVLGTGGWIAAIVATATRRGRAMGIVGIIVGALAPIVAFVVMFLAVVPYIPAS